MNLLDDGPLRRMRQDSRDGGLALALNLGDAPVRVAAAELVDSHNAELFALGGQGAPAHATVEIPPHSARLMCCRQP